MYAGKDVMDVCGCFGDTRTSRYFGIRGRMLQQILFVDVSGTLKTDGISIYGGGCHKGCCCTLDA